MRIVLQSIEANRTSWTPILITELIKVWIAKAQEIYRSEAYKFGGVCTKKIGSGFIVEHEAVA